jgi:sec-independent protein translocase protein TatC
VIDRVAWILHVKNIFQKIRAFVAQKWDAGMNEKNMSIIEHLEELRYRLIVIFLTIVGCFLALYPISESLLIILRAPIAEQLYMLAPAEAFVVYLKLAFFGAIVISLPMTLYQLWAFVAPGLYVNEKKYMLSFIALGTICFGIGGVFAYTVILPFGLKFLLGYGGNLIQPVISVSNYISFVTTMILVFGAVFELPLIVLFLAKMGIVTPGLMRRNRKYAILGAVIVGAILTPPDAFSQMLLAGPLVVLYEISIWVCVIFQKKPSEMDT